MSIIASFAVPHPPLIVPEIGKGNEKQIEKTTEYSSAQAHPQEKKAFFSKTNIRKVIIGCAVLVVVSVSICVVCHIKNIPEKEFKKGLKAYNEQNYEDAVEFFQKAIDHGHKKAKDEQLKALAEINYIKGNNAFKEDHFEDAVEYLTEIMSNVYKYNYKKFGTKKGGIFYSAQLQLFRGQFLLRHACRLFRS